MLQHYGAATRLLDFSRNVAVALWFASAEAPDEAGLLVGINAAKTKQLVTVSDTSRSMRETILMQDFPWTFTWQPRHAFERMRIQQSFFLFSRAESHPWGSLSLPAPADSEGGLYLVAVSPALKSDGSKIHSQRLFGLTGLTLFPDLEGFSRFQSVSAPYLRLR